MKVTRIHVSAAMFLIFVSISLTKAIDLILPYVSSPVQLLFPPLQKVIYQSSEFYSTVSINKFGFRGIETELGQRQVLAVGDSFTFGFGNNDDAVWPRLLEDELFRNGLNFRVYNLGVPGTDTIYHIATAIDYTRRLKPKYVVLSILISDDFQQVLEAREAALVTLYLYSLRLREYARLCFSNIYSHLRAFRSESLRAADMPGSPRIVTEVWKEDSLKYLNTERPPYKKHIVEKIKNGDINPGLLYYGKNYPNRSLSFWRNLSVKGSVENEALMNIKGRLSDLAKAVRNNGGELIIFSMPSGAYVKSKSFYNLIEYGFQLNDENLSSLEPEIVLATLSREIGAHFVPSLKEFRHLDGELFFPYDGHLTNLGNSSVARLLSNYLTGIHAKRDRVTTDR